MFLEKLGFLINYEKSQLLPSTYCQYLGLIINTKDMLLELPENKRIKIRDLIRKCENFKNCKIRDFASFIGSLGDCCKATLYGWAHMKDFEREKIIALSENNGSFEARMEIKTYLQDDFLWWKSNIMTVVNPIENFEFCFEIFSDSSNTGSNGEKIHGF